MSVFEPSQEFCLTWKSSTWAAQGNVMSAGGGERRMDLGDYGGGIVAKTYFFSVSDKRWLTFYFIFFFNFLKGGSPPNPVSTVAPIFNRGKKAFRADQFSDDIREGFRKLRESDSLSDCILIAQESGH